MSVDRRIACTVAILLAWSMTSIAQFVGPMDNYPLPTGTGRIRGRVVDAQDGSALRNSQVRLLRGPKEEVMGGTDDSGRFEFNFLPPGRYTITASKPGYMTLAYGQRRPFENGRPIDLADKQTLDDIELAVPRGGAIVVHVTGENGEPLSNVRVTAQRYSFVDGQRRLTDVPPQRPNTDDHGNVRIFGLPPGDYYLKATSSDALVPEVLQSGRKYVPVYYPGTPEIDNAERISLQVAREVRINLPVIPARVSRVTVTLRRSDGSVDSFAKGLVTTLLVRSMPAGRVIRRGGVGRTGTLSFGDLTPGDYEIEAEDYGPSRAEWEQGRVAVSVTGTDVANIVVPMTRGGSISGRVVFEPERPANARFTSVQPYVTSATVMVTSAASIPTAKDDGTFIINAVFAPGMVRVSTLPTGWFLKAIRLGGKDVTDVPLAVARDGTLPDVEIVLTQTRAGLNGTVMDDSGVSTGDYTVIVFPEDRAQWTPTTRFIFSARPDQQDHFKIAGMPPGQYLVVAVEYIEPGSERDPATLERLLSRAVPVTLSDGETKAMALKLSNP